LIALNFQFKACFQLTRTNPYFRLKLIQNLILQLTAPVRWTQTAKNMITDGATLFTEIGPGKVLQGLIKKVDKNAEVVGVQSFE
jgi:malonyl CoA-acyl carrier protein transacylase